LKTCQEIGLEYTDLLLALKLIKSLSISEEAQDVVFAALQAQTDPLDDILLQTMVCLTGLYGKSENTELEIKVESFEVRYKISFIFVWVIVLVMIMV